MHEVGLLRLPLAFGRAHADFALTEDGAVATKSVDGTTDRAAASTVVMRSGRHFAQFTVEVGRFMLFGVIRPGWDVAGGRAGRCICGRPLLLRHVQREAPTRGAPTAGALAGDAGREGR